jgi:hypothetical protein
MVKRLLRSAVNAALWLLLLACLFHSVPASAADEQASEAWHPRIDFAFPMLGPQAAGQIVYTGAPDGYATEAECKARLVEMEAAEPQTIANMAERHGIPSGMPYTSAASCKQSVPSVLAYILEQRRKALGQKDI